MTVQIDDRRVNESGRRVFPIGPSFSRSLYFYYYMNWEFFFCVIVSFHLFFLRKPLYLNDAVIALIVSTVFFLNKNWISSLIAQFDKLAKMIITAMRFAAGRFFFVQPRNENSLRSLKITVAERGGSSDGWVIRQIALTRPVVISLTVWGALVFFIFFLAAQRAEMVITRFTLDSSTRLGALLA